MVTRKSITASLSRSPPIRHSCAALLATDAGDLPLITLCAVKANKKPLATAFKSHGHAHSMHKSTHLAGDIYDAHFIIAHHHQKYTNMRIPPKQQWSLYNGFIS